MLKVERRKMATPLPCRGDSMPRPHRRGSTPMVGMMDILDAHSDVGAGSHASPPRSAFCTTVVGGNAARPATTLWRDGHVRPLQPWLLSTPMETTNVVPIQPCRGDGMPSLCHVPGATDGKSNVEGRKSEVEWRPCAKCQVHGCPIPVGAGSHACPPRTWFTAHGCYGEHPG